MLRLANPSGVHVATLTIAGEGVRFGLRPLSVGKRMELLQKVQNTNLSIDSYYDVIDAIAEVIVWIDGYPGRQPAELMRQMESPYDVNEIIQGVLSFNALSGEEQKNSDSSSQQKSSISPDQTDATRNAERGDEPVLTTPDQTGVLSPEGKG